MRIAYIAAAVIPSWTANSVQVMKVCQALQQNKNDVHLFVPGSMEVQWSELHSHYGVNEEFPIHWLRFQPIYKKLDFVLSAIREAKKLNADIVYTRLLWAAWFASNQGFRVILEVHDRPVGKLGARLFRGFLRMKPQKRIVLITRALKDILEKEYSLRFREDETLIAPDGVDLERYSERVEPSIARVRLGLDDRFTALYSGGFYEGRGLDNLMGLALRFPQVQFLWVGGKEDVVESWQRKLADARIRNIQLTGFIPNEQLPTYQQAADVLLMPYGKIIAGSSGGNIADVSSPMKMFEYMAAGRVILTSDISVLREVLNEKNACFYNTGDLDDLGSKFHRLMLDEELRKRLALQALVDVRQYSWQARMDKIITSLEMEK